MPENAKETKRSTTQGGLAFFISFIVLLVVCAINFRIFFSIERADTLHRWVIFTLCAALAFFLAPRILTNRIMVFIHEFKHEVVARLMGNRIKGMKVRRNSGHLEYEYTARTAHLNALIALAPYWFPLFTLSTLATSAFFWKIAPSLSLSLVSLGYGIDLSLSERDLKPHQTDLTQIRGGFLMGKAYVLAMNLAIFSAMVFWLSDGPDGWKAILAGYIEIGADILLTLR